MLPPLEAMPITATDAGDATLSVLVIVPDDAGSFQGLGGINRAATLEFTVAERPVAGIEIHDPGYVAYAGTSFRIRGTVQTDDGREHADNQHDARLRTSVSAYGSRSLRVSC